MQKLFALVLLLAVAAQAAQIELPVARRAFSKKTIESLLAFDAANRAGKFITLPRDQANLPLVNDDELLYSCQIGLGTPVQVFATQDLDTGSSNLWVPGPQCSKCGFAGTPYNSAASKTYVANGEALSIQYGSGSVTGTLAQDTLSIAGLVVEKQIFGVINTAQGFKGSGITGLLGLAYQKIAEDNVPTPLENMVSQGLISANMFAFYLSSSVSTPGQVTFGGYNSSFLVGEPTYVPIVADEWYVIQVSKITIGGHTASLLGGHGIVDTGTSLLIVPTSVATTLNKYITVDATCGSANMNNPNITITLGGTEFNLTPAQYIVELSPKQCVNGIQGANIGEGLDFILGDVFMRSVYTIFDVENNRLGFGQLPESLRK
eukprot:Amastigsp_a508713_414.p2 type:complete len:376 gc:universal Amastigsp_a508713_414:31-1158(+)